jgi:hypothetical protein
MAGDRFSANRPQSQADSRSAEAVAELVSGCERAVFDHYFAEIYPRQIRERTRQILRLAQWLDEQARTGDFGELDELSCLLLPPFERAIEEHAAMRRRLRSVGWYRGSGGGQ